MKDSKTLAMVATLILILCITLTGAGYVAYRYGILEPYQEFRVKEHEATPLFDALNEKVERNLPPLPPNTVLAERKSNGIVSAYSGHGRWLYIDIKTQMTPEYISEYYRSHLLDNGWLKHPFSQASGSNFYIRGTGCISILLPGQYNSEYHIFIWHDFRSQPFSPPVPNEFSMRFFELEGSRFAHCSA